jgi:DNA-binding MarR family transcriptional regulator
MPRSRAFPFAVTREVRDTCMCLHAQRAARVLARRYDEALRPASLTNGQFSLLMSLHRPSPPNMGEVSQLLGMDNTTVTANLKPLARRGLVKMTVDDEDKRSRRIVLTEAGRILLATALPLWRRAQAKTLTKGSGRAHMLRALSTLSAPD